MIAGDCISALFVSCVCVCACMRRIHGCWCQVACGGGSSVFDSKTYRSKPSCGLLCPYLTRPGVMRRTWGPLYAS